MDDFLFVTFSNSINNLFKDGNCLRFRDFFHYLNLFLQRALCTILNDHKFQVFVFETFVTLEQIGTIELHHNFRLLLGQSFSNGLDFYTLLTIDVSEVKNFYGHEFIGLLIYSFVDLGKGSLPNLLEETILFDFDVFKVFLELQIISVSEVKRFVPGLNLFLG
jgi:hypothetical protein